MNLKLRPGKAADARACGKICYEAFKTISQAHNFPPDLPTADIATEVVGWMLVSPRFYSVVAEIDGKIVGSNFLDERNPISGIGPITIDPGVQNKTIGRRLMQDVMDRAAQKKVRGVRLVQAAFHNRSLSLYTKLGFDVRETLSVMQGPALKLTLPGYTVRPAKAADIHACNRVCVEVHGFDRGGELIDMINQGNATVVEHDGRITGYASIIGFFGHAVGETNEDMKALIAASKVFAGPGFLMPSRNAELFRWCLANGLRIVQPMTLMSMGTYNEPKGAFLPSITY